MHVTIGGMTFDVATFRTDGGYQDGRHPETIQYDTAEHDAQRRDFTVNALFYDPLEERLIDYVGGEADLRAGILRTVGDARRRFQEDRLRLLRAIRFASVCGWQIEPATWEALVEEAPHLGCVSIERIRTEFIRTLCEAPSPDGAMELFFSSGLLEQFLPEMLPLRGCLQDPIFHPEGDVWAHTLKMLSLIGPAPRDPHLVWAVLLHDIAKPQAFVVHRYPDGSPKYRTPRHADIGAPIAEAILRRFKEPRELIVPVVEAVRHHMQFRDLPKMGEAALRRHLGRPSMQLELALHRLDVLGAHGKMELYNFAKEQLERFASEPVLPPAIVMGKDLLLMGYKSGPAVGRRLKDLYAKQLEGATRLELLAEALREMPERPSNPHKVAILFGPKTELSLEGLWRDFSARPGAEATAIVLPGRAWEVPYDPALRLLRLVGDCAGNVEDPPARSFVLLIAAATEPLSAELAALAPRVLKV